MKATGIVRRIDDLGRVVIPKEIRRTLRIREGDPLEIFVDRDGEVILKKYSPFTELGDFSQEYAESLYDSLNYAILICDRDTVISAAGVKKKDFVERKIGPIVETVIQERRSAESNDPREVEFVDGRMIQAASYFIAPIIASGDAIGAVVLFSEERSAGEAEQKSAFVAAAFFGKQMER
ncbi:MULTISPECIES: stage V sporulation protein T [Bacillaceae]|uniref:Stage VI sporulation protein D n=1 Tax=Domibacillus aminovorans TaxID=29332 RepID=A0A177KUG4_9BACI|nr:MULTISPECIES: stage V sporulation protein T [Bacillaceae]OAH56777.1 stage VI sporulation protein D [Domibacillus aminovorans]